MELVTVTDENGVDFHGLLDKTSEHVDTDGETRHDVWVYFNKSSGFGSNVGEVSMRKLKRLDSGKYGA